MFLFSHVATMFHGCKPLQLHISVWNVSLVHPKLFHRWWRCKWMWNIHACICGFTVLMTSLKFKHTGFFRASPRPPCQCHCQCKNPAFDFYPAVGYMFFSQCYLYWAICRLCKNTFPSLADRDIHDKGHLTTHKIWTMKRHSFLQCLQQTDFPKSYNPRRKL